MDNLDDLLGPAPSLDDMLGKPPRKTKKTSNKHKKLQKPRGTPQKGGIFELRAKAEKAGTLGKECLIDGVKLKKSRNGQRVICGKYECFRAYRNAYRLDYDRVSASGDR